MRKISPGIARISFLSQLSSQLEMWISELDQTRLPESLEEAEIALRAHTDSVQHMTSTTYQVLQAGQDLASVLESSGVNVMADAQYSSGSRVSVLLEFLNEREMDLEDLAEVKRVKLEQCVQLCQYRVDANQVTHGTFSTKFSKLLGRELISADQPLPQGI